MPAKQFKRFANWLEDDPRRVITLPLVTASLGGMLYLAFPVASAIKAGMAVSLAPTLGQSGAQAIAAGFSGALASGVSSLWAHASPMALYNRPFNPGQLGLDVGMSAGFGFLGFVFANGIKQAASVFNGFGKAGLAGRLAFTSSALVGYEVGKDYLQNLAHLKLQHVRYRGLPVVENPKNFRDILKPTVKMEFGTNFWRAIPGLEDQPGLKATFDTLGRVIWDGILNSVNPENVELNRQRLAQQRGLKPVDIIDHDEALRAVDLAHN